MAALCSKNGSSDFESKSQPVLVALLKEPVLCSKNGSSDFESKSQLIRKGFQSRSSCVQRTVLLILKANHNLTGLQHSRMYVVFKERFF